MKSGCWTEGERLFFKLYLLNVVPLQVLLKNKVTYFSKRKRIMTYWKRQNHEDGKKPKGAQGILRAVK